MKLATITAHVTSATRDRVKLAADSCQLTDSEYAAGVLAVASRLRLMRMELGWRRVLKREWWGRVWEL